MSPLNADDARDAARRRLPRFLFDYVDGGAGEETTLAANTSDLSNIRLRQRVLASAPDRVKPTHTFLHMHLSCTLTRARARMHMHASVHMHTHACAHARTHTRTHTHTHTHTHTLTCRRARLHARA